MNKKIIYIVVLILVLFVTLIAFKVPNKLLCAYAGAKWVESVPKEECNKLTFQQCSENNKCMHTASRTNMGDFVTDGCAPIKAHCE